MKSFVCEGKTLNEVIERAWKNAKYPEIFSIKILSKGKKSFFWWKSEPWKIAFFYEILFEEKKQNSNSEQRNLAKNERGNNFKVIRNQNLSDSLSQHSPRQEQKVDVMKGKETVTNKFPEKDKQDFERKNFRNSTILSAREITNIPSVSSKKENTPKQEYHKSENIVKKENFSNTQVKNTIASQMQSEKDDKDSLQNKEQPQKKFEPIDRVFQQEWVDFSKVWIENICKSFSVTITSAEYSIIHDNRYLSVKIHFSGNLLKQGSLKGIGYSLSVLLQEAIKKKYPAFDSHFHRVIVNETL